MDAAILLADENGHSYMKDFFQGMKDEYVIQTQGKHIISLYPELQDKTKDEIMYSRYHDSMYTELDAAAYAAGLTVEELLDKFETFGYIKSAVDNYANSVLKTSDAYSVLKTSVENWNEIQEQSQEIIHDGIEISEDAYNSLKEQLSGVTVGTEGFADAIDTTDGYIVKNSKLF